MKGTGSSDVRAAGRRDEGRVSLSDPPSHTHTHLVGETPSGVSLGQEVHGAKFHFKEVTAGRPTTTEF